MKFLYMKTLTGIDVAKFFVLIIHLVYGGEK